MAPHKSTAAAKHSGKKHSDKKHSDKKHSDEKHSPKCSMAGLSDVFDIATLISEAKWQHTLSTLAYPDSRAAFEYDRAERERHMKSSMRSREGFVVKAVRKGRIVGAAAVGFVREEHFPDGTRLEPDRDAVIIPPDMDYKPWWDVGINHTPRLRYMSSIHDVRQAHGATYQDFRMITDICVDKKHQGKGIERKLLEEVIKQADIDTVTLVVILYEDLQEIYRGLGFENSPKADAMAVASDPDDKRIPETNIIYDVLIREPEVSAEPPPEPVAGAGQASYPMATVGQTIYPTPNMSQTTYPMSNMSQSAYPMASAGHASYPTSSAWPATYSTTNMSQATYSMASAGQRQATQPTASAWPTASPVPPAEGDVWDDTYGWLPGIGGYPPME